MVQVYSPREAMKLAKKLGWEVEPARRSGDIEFKDPDGRRFSCRAPGRADNVPLALAKALSEALEQDKQRRSDGG